MNIVVTNGCPGSRWEALFSALNAQPENDSFSQWLDELFSTLGITGMQQSSEPIEPASHMTEKVLSLFSSIDSETLFLADSRTLWLLDFLSKHFPQAKFLLFYVNAENGLAHAFQQAKDPEGFMATWYAVNQHLICFQRRHRHCSLLLNADAAIQHPEALKKACKRMGIELSSSILVSKPLERKNMALERFLTKQYLQEQSYVYDIQLELEASAQPLGDTSDELLQPLDLYQDYQEQQLRLADLIQTEKAQKLLIDESQNEINALAEINKKLKENYQVDINEAEQARVALVAVNAKIEQENELLLLQLHQVQEELEAVFIEKQKIKQTEKLLNTQLKQVSQERDKQSTLIADHHSQLTKVQQKKESVIATHREAEQEHELLLLQLHQAQEELKTVFIEKQQIEQTEKVLNTQLKQVSQERDKQSILIADHHSQLTKFQQGKESLIATHREAEQENELLLLQLHQVQEELENYFLKCQELVQKERKEQDSLEFVDVTVPPPSSTPIIKRTKKVKKREQRHAAILKSSELFDGAWYLAQYPDVAETSIGVAEHYLRYGAIERRDPSPNFSTAFYLDNNPDIDVMTVNPLIHYIQFGREEGRPISNKVNVVW